MCTAWMTVDCAVIVQAGNVGPILGAATFAMDEE